LLQQLEGRGIDPVRVLDHEQKRLAPRHAAHHLHQHVDELAPEGGRRGVRRRIAIVARQVEEG
jgi:hypothetical protein